MRTKIYTKTGDHGETSMIGGDRISKADERLSAYGTVDEMNAFLGVCRLYLAGNPALARVEQIIARAQNDLFAIGSQLACADEKLRPQLPMPHTSSVFDMEAHIDTMTNEMPELKEFILPGGSAAAAHLHLARTVCRRAEREIVKMTHKKSPSQDAFNGTPIVLYLNRLGDYLFVAARYCNHILGHQETKWFKG